MQDEGERAKAQAELVRELADGLARKQLDKTRLAQRTGLGRTTVQNAFSTSRPVASAVTLAALAKPLGIPEELLFALRRRAVGESSSMARDDSPTSLPLQSPAAPGDVAKAARVLAVLPLQALWLHALRSPGLFPIHVDTVQSFDEACGKIRLDVIDFIDPDVGDSYTALVTTMTELEHFMDSNMYGPDPGWPWRDLTRHQPQRAKDFAALAGARSRFSTAYLVLVNLLNLHGLLPSEAEGVVGLQESSVGEDERRARVAAETGPTLTALTELNAFPADPTERHELYLLTMTPESVEKSLGLRDDLASARWQQERRGLVSALHAASVDISDDSLRARIDQVRLILNTPQGPWECRQQRESSTRKIAVDHAMDSVGAFRRGSPIPNEPAEYVKALQDVRDYIEEWNNSGL